MYFLHIRSRRHRIALVVAIILAGVVIDLLFSAHPALSIGILLAGTALVVMVRLVVGHAGPGRS
jgi:hypothetical protein